VHPPSHRTAAWRQTRALAWLSVLPVVGAIAVSCTDAAGAWCSQTFDVEFRALFGNGGAAFWTIRFVAEKSIHVTLFTILGAALFRAFRGVLQRAWWAVAIGCALGGCSELLQRLFPTRDPAIRDVLINGTGVGLGVMISFCCEKVFDVGRASCPVRAEGCDSPTSVLDIMALSSRIGFRAVEARRWPAVAGENAHGCAVGENQDAFVGEKSKEQGEKRGVLGRAEIVSE
jgi:VanZ like family